MQRIAFAEHPVFEAGAIGQGHVGEERPLVHLDQRCQAGETGRTAFRFAVGARRKWRGEINGRYRQRTLLRQANMVATGGNERLSGRCRQHRAQLKQRLAQVQPCGLLRRIGPEQIGQGLAPVRAGLNRQVGQQRRLLAVAKAVNGFAIPEKAQRPERRHDQRRWRGSAGGGLEWSERKTVHGASASKGGDYREQLTLT